MYIWRQIESGRITYPAYVYGNANDTIENTWDDKRNTHGLIPRDDVEFIHLVEAPF